MKRPREPPPKSTGPRGPLSLSADRVESILKDFRGYDKNGTSPTPSRSEDGPSSNGRQYPPRRWWRGKWGARTNALPAPREGLGTALRPRASTHPAVDEAAQSVAEAILGEAGNQKAFGRSLEMYVSLIAVSASGARCSVTGAAPVKMAHEWDVPRIINDRIWNWMEHRAFEAPPLAHLKNGHSLPRGIVTIEVYHRCIAGCRGGEARITDLVSPEARGLTPHTLVACPYSGLVHLCRARSDSCASLQESQDTQLVCRTSGRVCMEAGVAASHEVGDVNQERHMRTMEYELDAHRMQEVDKDPDAGREEEGGGGDSGGDDADSRAVDRLCRRGRPDANDPENARRAAAVDAMVRARCPQIVEWDRELGRLVLDLRNVPRAGETHFDPTFFWAHPPATAPAAPVAETVGGALGGAPLSRSESLMPSVRRSTFEKTALANMACMTSAKRKKRSMRAKRTRDAQRMYGNPDSGLVDREREEVESVLDDLLWDAETRAHINAEHRVQAERLASAAIQERIQQPQVQNLFLSVIQSGQGGGGAEAVQTRVLSASAVHEAALHAVRHHLVPIVPYQTHIHYALVHAILYLWGFVVHNPVGVEGGDASPSTQQQQQQQQQQQRVRRNTDVRTASLSQFALGFLYTAADSGVRVQNQEGWPRDWWLKDQLPDVKIIDRFGSGRGAQRVRAAREAKVSSTRGGLVPPAGDCVMATWGEGAWGVGGGGEGVVEGFRSKKQGMVRIYQPQTVSRGKRAVASAVCRYEGALPTQHKVRETLQNDFAKAHTALSALASPTQVHRRPGGSGKKAPKTPGVAAAITTTMTTELQPFSHALWQRQRRLGRANGFITPSMAASPTTSDGGVGGGGGGEGGDGVVHFSCLYVLEGRRAHICVTYDPYDPKGPPGLEHGDEMVLGFARMREAPPPPPVDTVVGPFVREEAAREYSLEWAKGMRSLADRRQYGIDLAHSVGLGVWHSPPAPIRSSRAEHTLPHDTHRRGEDTPAAPEPFSHPVRRQRMSAFRALVGTGGWSPQAPRRADSAVMDLSA